MTRTDFDRFVNASTENRRLLREEELIAEATEAICELMATENVSRSELAKRIGTTKSYITQILSGSRNMTLRTLADLADAFDCRIQLQLTKETAWTGGQELDMVWSKAATSAWSVAKEPRGASESVESAA